VSAAATGLTEAVGPCALVCVALWRRIVNLALTIVTLRVYSAWASAGRQSSAMEYLSAHPATARPIARALKAD